jgi:threonine/homoserine/homoserine lactone efflux protein
VARALGLGGAAFLVALSGAMAPGPFLTVTITRTLTQGRLSAALMLAGHAALEGLLLVGFAFGLQRVLTEPHVARALALVGGAALLWMGRGLLRDALTAPVPTASTAAPVRSRLGPVLHGAAISLASPYWTLWWATIGIKLAADALRIGWLGIVAFLIGHQLADVTWYGLVIAAVSSGRRVLAERPYRVVLAACALFLLYLGARFFLDGIGVL